MSNALKFTAEAECADCPECQKILVLAQLAPDQKRPFVDGHITGWVLTCPSCGTDFPARTSQLFHAAVEMARVH